jgi:osmotically-inducible protein OsmY
VDRSASDLSIEVRDGVVTLAGQVTARSLVDLSVRLVEGIDGVVNVVDHLRYSFDDTRRAPALGP